MKSHFYHIQVNIDFSNLPFYKELFSFMGWSIIFEEKEVIGYKSEKTGDIWFVPAPKKVQTDYDAIGVNHISLRVEEQKDVDAVTEFIQKKEIPPLFNTPRHRPEFASTENDTYYQVMFESPDKVLFEIVYIGPKDEE